MKYAVTFLAGAIVGLYGGAWILGVWMQATPERAHYIPSRTEGPVLSKWQETTWTAA